MQLEGREVQVSVHHTLYEEKAPIPGTRDALAVGYTQAFVLTSKGYAFHGIAYCSDSEQDFDPERGRKLAISRAIADWPKKYRAMFWSALREQAGWVW